jgi:prevent-host-death family protein
MRSKRSALIRRGKRSGRRRRSWQVQEAKAKFSELIQETTSSGYQTITKNGKPVAYVISKEEFEAYVKPSKSLIDVFDACPYPEIDFDVDRIQDKTRDFDL